MMGNAEVLIIEDDDDIRLSLQEMLELEGYRVAVAKNGKEGLERLREQACMRLILLDMMMPIMNGEEFLKIKNAETALASVPVVVFSAIAEKPGLAGVTGYVRKPVDIDVLLNLVKNHCR